MGYRWTHQQFKIGSALLGHVLRSTQLSSAKTRLTQQKCQKPSAGILEFIGKWLLISTGTVERGRHTRSSWVSGLRSNVCHRHGNCTLILAKNAEDSNDNNNLKRPHVTRANETIARHCPGFHADLSRVRFLWLLNVQNHPEKIYRSHCHWSQPKANRTATTSK